jgi:hypothetical protein
VSRRSTPRKSKARGEVMAPLSVLDKLDSLLKEHLAIFQTKGELTEAEIEHWHRDLGVFPIPAIEYAFDCWRRNGRFFPVYGDILDLCIAWAPAEKTGYVKCDAECRERHHRGYNEVDIKTLYQLVVAKVSAAERMPQNKLTKTEISELLDQLDAKRGSSPDWRKQRVL